MNMFNLHECFGFRMLPLKKKKIRTNTNYLDKTEEVKEPVIPYNPLYLDKQIKYIDLSLISSVGGIASTAGS